MFDRIVYISDKGCNIKLKDAENVSMNLMNLHLIFEDDKKKVLGEVDDLDGDIVKARFLGEIVNNKVIPGTLRKPKIDAKVRVVQESEIPMVCGTDTEGFMKLGNSPFYDGFPIYLDVNSFFSNHFAIMGNTGSGKSCGVTRLFQNMFHDQRLYPYKANILLFDSSGEYYNAFSNLNTINPNYHYRFISTNESDGLGEKLRLPIYLLNAQDLALLLQCTSHSQLPIVERMLKLALIFSQKDVDANKYKNHLIAKAIMTILYTNETSPNKRNEIFSIIASCSTPQFNLEAPVQGIGYTRKFRECFLIDSEGQFSESVLLTEYVTSFIDEKYDDYEPKGGVFYNLDTLEKALNFTLISEGWLRNEQTYGDGVTIRVRLHALIVGDNAKYFDVNNYITLEDYLSSLILDGGRKYQIININLDDVDDDFAKVIVKIFSRLVFEFAKGLKNRGSIPFHIICEEAHRYIQNDTDRFLIGYNIFERIAKEGRKYGVILGLITQRPVELSDTVISQCTNFLIFKMNHPVDVEYIRKMVPNISDEIVEKQKTLQSGTCLGFGLGFRIPLIIKMEMPNPAPWSGNADVVQIWNGNRKGVSNVRMNSTDVGVTVSNNVNDINAALNMTAIPEMNLKDEGDSPDKVNSLIDIVDAPKEELTPKEDSVPKEEPIEAEVPKTDNGIPLVSVVDENNNQQAPISEETKIENTEPSDSPIPLINVVDSNQVVDQKEIKEEVPSVEEQTPEVKEEVVQEEKPVEESSDNDILEAIKEPIIEEEKSNEGFQIPELVDTDGFNLNSDDLNLNIEEPKSEEKSSSSEIDLNLDNDSDGLDPEDFS